MHVKKAFIASAVLLLVWSTAISNAGFVPSLSQSPVISIPLKWSENNTHVLVEVFLKKLT